MKKGKNLTLELPQESIETPSPVRDGTASSKLRERENESDDERTEHHNVVEFEEYNAQETKQTKKKHFSIEIPQIRCADTKQKDGLREPPAPSHRQESKSFVFPTTESRLPPKPLKNVDDLQRAFERERQQFYQEKSKFEKEIIIKDGQIEMLQGIITGKLGRNESQCFETIILEKDLQLNELLKKINELSECLEKKSSEMGDLRHEMSKVKTENEALKNEVYVYTKKEESDQLTKQFYQQKAGHFKPPTPRPLYEDKFVSKREDNKYSGIEDLQRRLQHLKHNRVEMEDRNRTRPEIVYSQTSKNKSGREIRAIFRDQQFKHSRY